MIESLPDLKLLAASIERRHLGMLNAIPEATDDVIRGRAESYMAGVRDALHALQDATEAVNAREDATP